MKLFFSLAGLLIYFSSFICNAQPQAVSIEYNDAAFIRNINLNYRHAFLNNTFSLYGGIGCYLNNNLYLSKIFPAMDGTPDEGAMFYGPRPTNLWIRTGIKLGVEKTIKLPGNAPHAFIFYDFQYYSPEVAGWGVLPFGSSSTSVVYQNVTATVTHLYLQHLGFGFRAKVHKALNVKLMGGVGAFKLTGAGFIWSSSENIPQSWQFSRMFGVGVEYSLFKEKEPKKKKK